MKAAYFKGRWELRLPDGNNQVTELEFLEGLDKDQVHLIEEEEVVRSAPKPKMLEYYTDSFLHFATVVETGKGTAQVEIDFIGLGHSYEASVPEGTNLRVGDRIVMIAYAKLETDGNYPYVGGKVVMVV